MNRCFLFGRITLACGLIVALTTSTAVCQFYDPLGVQNKYKPFGQYGPTFQYTSPTKFMNAVSGRSNHPSNQRIAQRVSPSRATRLENLHLSVTKPGGNWVESNSEEIGSGMRYMISRQDPSIVISLAGEQIDTNANQASGDLLAESQAKLKDLGAKIEPGEQRISANGINGVSYSASIADGQSTTYYAMWVASHQGYNYKLAVYGDKHNKSMIDTTLRNFVHGIHSIQPTSVAHRNTQKATVTR